MGSCGRVDEHDVDGGPEARGQAFVGDPWGGKQNIGSDGLSAKTCHV